MICHTRQIGSVQSPTINIIFSQKCSNLNCRPRPTVFVSLAHDIVSAEDATNKNTVLHIDSVAYNNY